jgi:ABC-type amino acid transport substrate-binding protein
MKRLRRILCSLLTGIVFLAASGGICHAVSLEVILTPEEKEFIAEHPVITLAVDPDSIPYEFFDVDGEYKGITADFVELLCERTGLNLVPVEGLTWTEAYQKTADKEIDVLACVVMTPERQQHFIFSDSYFSFKRAIFLSKSNNDIKSIKDLANMHVAVQTVLRKRAILEQHAGSEPAFIRRFRTRWKPWRKEERSLFIGYQATNVILYRSHGHHKFEIY